MFMLWVNYFLYHIRRNEWNSSSSSELKTELQWITILHYHSTQRELFLVLRSLQLIRVIQRVSMSISTGDLQDILQNQQKQFELWLKSLSVGKSVPAATSASLPKFESKKVWAGRRKAKTALLTAREQRRDAQRACLSPSVQKPAHQQ